MIRISKLRLPVEHTEEDLCRKLAKILRIASSEIKDFEIVRQSIDARKKPVLYFEYTIDVKVEDRLEKKLLQKNSTKSNITKAVVRPFAMPGCLSKKPVHAPVIVGSGPAGLFCGWLLARCGFCPIILERGDAVEVRKEKVERFWNGGELDIHSNVQFGEGGAGTFSDGKLNTSVKDPLGRNRQVLQMFVDAGAPKEILYQQKPHLGTDQLMMIVRNLRKQIEEMGGQIRFNSCATDVRIAEASVQAVQINGKEWLACDRLVLALGHSARDTFFMLYDRGVAMEAKAFAAGVRIEHPQEVINTAQYGCRKHSVLGAAPYKLTHQTESGRGIYTFCMCPGGYVVNASSEPGRLAINGMSYQKRDSSNANSALIVTVRPEDYATYADAAIPEALRGIAFQRELEEKAYRYAEGKIPVQCWGDFKRGIPSARLGGVHPCIKGSYEPGDVRGILPEFMGDAIAEGIEAFGRKIKGFSEDDSVLSAVESRSSSPVRIVRDQTMQNRIHGIYPCGEGAGYAGGITSAAIDGLKTAQAIAAEEDLC